MSALISLNVFYIYYNSTYVHEYLNLFSVFEICVFCHLSSPSHFYISILHCLCKFRGSFITISKVDNERYRHHLNSKFLLLLIRYPLHITVVNNHKA